MLMRKKYLDKLIMNLNNDFVKILTGVRRCGKSSMLILLKDYLLEQGVTEKQFIEINYEKYIFDHLKDDKALHSYIDARIIANKRMYIFIDEVQELTNWGRLINSLRVSYDCDIYVTGSNSNMFSGEYLTYLSGRYIEIKIYPLSYQEFLFFKQYDTNHPEKYFNEYLRVGSFPAISLAQNEELIEAILAGLFDSIFSRDIILRGNIKDDGSFYKVAKFVFENIGNQTSANAIKNTMVSHGHKITSDTVDNYLKLMCDAHLLYQCKRFDIRGKERLKTNGKYYVVDMGLRNRLIGYRSSNIGHVIENIVYLQLLRLGYTVYVGKNMAKEVDFIAMKGEQIAYFQVALTALELETHSREINALFSIGDQYPKYLITTDTVNLSKNGIIHLNLFDFLLDKN